MPSLAVANNIHIMNLTEVSVDSFSVILLRNRNLITAQISQLVGFFATVLLINNLYSAQWSSDLTHQQCSTHP